LAAAGVNYALTTSLDDDVSVKLATDAWQLLISIGIISPAGELPLGSVPLDRDGIERAVTLVVEGTSR
jgi:hypothetical protein